MNSEQGKGLVRVCVCLMALFGLQLQSHVRADSTTNSGQAYIEECAAAGVPVPPDWGDTAWKGNGWLDPDKNLLVLYIESLGSSTAPNAKVFYYESSNPKGVCIALPRTFDNGGVQTLGIICQGDNGKACFWDNSTFTLSSINESKPLLDFTGGADLVGKGGGVCTSCHAGENVFIIHPNTALDLTTSRGINLKPREYAMPIVDGSWPQNERPNTIDGECSTCHNQFRAGRLPQLSTAIQPLPTNDFPRPEGYCNTILTFVYGLTMPPDGTAPSTAFETHWENMLSACGEPPPALKPMSSPQYRPGIGWAIIATLVD